MGFFRTLFGWLPFVKANWEVEYGAIKKGDLPDPVVKDFEIETQALRLKYANVKVFIERLADEDKLLRILGSLQRKKAVKIRFVMKAAKVWSHLTKARDRALKPIFMAHRKLAALAATEAGVAAKKDMDRWVRELDGELQKEIDENNAEIAALRVSGKAIDEQIEHTTRYLQFLRDDKGLNDKIIVEIQQAIGAEQAQRKDMAS